MHDSVKGEGLGRSPFEDRLFQIWRQNATRNIREA